MKIVTIEQVRSHCKADSEDDASLTICANAAERMCEQLANRAIFKTQGELDAAIAEIPADMAAAFTVYKDAVSAASALDEDNKPVALDAAEWDLMQTRVRANNSLYGMVATDDVVAAVLLITAHLYRNREEVSPADMKQVPMAAERIMRWYRRVGPL